MIISTFSDIHLEFIEKHEDKLNYFKLLNINLDDVDVLCLCGDIDYDIRNIIFAEEITKMYKNLQVVVVDGNHSFYRKSIESSENKQKEYSKNLKRVHYLSNDSIIIDDVKFIGSCLWSDFKNNDERIIHHAWQNLNDYKKIRYLNGTARFSPYRASFLNKKTTDYIVNEVNNSKEKCVIVSHYKPYPTELGAKDDLTYAYECNLFGKFTDKFPELFLYGHTHQSEDESYMDDEFLIRFVSNPVGYCYQQNTEFKNNLKIEI